MKFLKKLFEPTCRVFSVKRLSSKERKVLRDSESELKDLILRHSKEKVYDNMTLLAKGGHKDEERGVIMGAIRAHYDFVVAFTKATGVKKQDGYQDIMNKIQEELLNNKKV